MRLIIIGLLILLLTLFGCTTIQNPATSNELIDLREQYSVQNVYSTDLDIMNSYITELSLLRARSTMPFANVVDAELFTAQSFYYFSKALEESSQINYSSNYCTSKVYKSSLMYLEISQNYSNKAISALSIVLPTDNHLLRKNNLELVSSFNSNAKELISSLKELC